MSENIEIPILCYHRVHADDDPDIPKVKSGEYCGHVTVSVFKRHMALLSENGFTVVTHHVIAEWLYGERALPAGPLVAVDFDDNRLNVFENAFPIMREYGFKGTVFCVSRLAYGELPEMQAYPWMNWSHLGELMEHGWVVGGHTASHVHLAQLYMGASGVGGPERVLKELTDCDEAIRKELGIVTAHFAYPSGDWSAEVEAFVARRYRTARLWFGDDQVMLNDFKTHPYRLKAVNASMNMSDDMLNAVLRSKGGLE